MWREQGHRRWELKGVEVWERVEQAAHAYTRALWANARRPPRGCRARLLAVVISACDERLPARWFFMLLFDGRAYVRREGGWNRERRSGSDKGQASVLIPLIPIGACWPIVLSEQRQCAVLSALLLRCV